MRLIQKATGQPVTVTPTPARGGGMVQSAGQPARWFSDAQIKQHLKKAGS